MEEREWWYRLRFEAPEIGDDERLRLVFHGLDTFATLWLDGELLGGHANMFRPAAFAVPPGEHEVAIRFDPPAAHAGPDLPGQWAPNDHGRVWMRKAQFGFGWDWGPRLPTIGLWRPVELRRERRAAIAGVRVDTLDRAGPVRVRADADPFAGAPGVPPRLGARGAGRRGQASPAGPGGRGGGVRGDGLPGGAGGAAVVDARPGRAVAL